MGILALMVIFDTAESTLINAISKIADLFFALLGIFVDFFFSYRNKKQCLGSRDLLELTCNSKCLRRSCNIR